MVLLCHVPHGIGSPHQKSELVEGAKSFFPEVAMGFEAFKHTGQILTISLKWTSSAQILSPLMTGFILVSFFLLTSEE